MNMRKIVVASTIAVMLGGCTGMTKEDQGALLGGVLGGVIGAQIGGGSGRTIATIAGVLVGGYVGHEIGQHADRQDRSLHERAVANTIAHGTPSHWYNPRNRHSGGTEDLGFIYYPPPASSTGYCREYREYIVIDGREAGSHVGVACQQKDGSWRIVK